MDFSKIFIKNACPTKAGGQAVMEGVMMKNADKSAIAVRVPDGRIHLKTEQNPAPKKIAKVPLLRGVYVFVLSLVMGMKTLTYSADVLMHYGEEEYEDDRLSLWLTEKFGEKKAWSIMMGFSMVIAILVSIVVFVIGPTWAVNAMKHVTAQSVLLNLAEGLLRILLFVLYVFAISKVPDIKRLFQYHGAEHKSIHCYENNLELTPENCQQFSTLHPRCGTSFLMFVFVIALVLFSLLGWPSLLWRIVSRLLLLPVIAGLSYELLQWAGRSDNIVVKILSVPGLLLQKLTTAEPDNEHLEVAIVSLKAVLAEAPDYGEGICDEEAHIVLPESITEEHEEEDGR